MSVSEEVNSDLSHRMEIEIISIIDNQIVLVSVLLASSAIGRCNKI